MLISHPTLTLAQVIELAVLPMNFTLALLLAAACFIFARDYYLSSPTQSSLFSIFGWSWVLNGCHVALSACAQFLPLQSHIAKHDITILMTVGFTLSQLGSILIIVGVIELAFHAMRNAVMLVTVGVVLPALFYDLYGAMHDLTMPWFVESTLVLLSCVAIALMAYAMRRIIVDVRPRLRIAAIVWPLYGYVVIQLLYPLGQLVSWAHPVGFALGCILKGIHLVGLAAHERSESLDDRMIAGRDPEIVRLQRTVSEAVHEVKVSILQLEVNLPEFSEALRLRLHTLQDLGTVIGEAGQRALAVLEGTHLLLVGRGGVEREEEWVDFKITSALQAAVIAVRSTARAYYGKREVSFVCRFSGNMYIRCRRYALTRAFINVLRNTYDALGPAGGEVIITARWIKIEGSADRKRNAVVDIVDAGAGITAADLSHVFDSGFTRRLGEHRGHGLKIARAIVSAHSGSIELHSPPYPGHKGTRVEIVLPDTKSRDRRGSTND